MAEYNPSVLDFIREEYIVCKEFDYSKCKIIDFQGRKFFIDISPNDLLVTDVTSFNERQLKELFARKKDDVFNYFI